MKTRFHPVAVTIFSALALASLLPATDLSVYREFHLGSSPADIAKLAGMESSAATLVSSRPERIEELDWKINRFESPAARLDSVSEIRFRFFNGKLYEMMVSYDRDHTGGLTDADMSDALSAIYGPASAPVAKEMSFNSEYTSTVRVIAQWHDRQSLVSLVGFSYGGGFGMIVSSNDSLALAQVAMVESDRLDRVEAPQKAQALRAKEATEAADRDEQLRLLNKPDFRP